MIKYLRNQKGITLLALVITIVVLLILSIATLRLVMSDNGIIGKAKEAVDDYDTSAEKESKGIDSLDGEMDIYAEKAAGIKEDNWVMAWTCTNKVWGNTITDHSNPLNGDIVVKLYKLSNQITIDYLGTSNAYYMIIEGSGEMGPLSDENGIYGYYKEYLNSYNTEYNDFMRFITNVRVSGDIKNISESAFKQFTSLKQISLPNSIEKIDKYAFAWCSSLKGVFIPESIKTIDSMAFYSDIDGGAADPLRINVNVKKGSVTTQGEYGEPWVGLNLDTVDNINEAGVILEWKDTTVYYKATLPKWK